ncbi:MAG: hypothetical protein ABEK01_01045 [Candidatus Nanohaloarchaea archaeon]
MDITEEVDRRRTTVQLDDPDTAYAEMRDLLTEKMGFDEVSEEKYFNDVDEGRVRTKLKAVEGFDRYSRGEYDILFEVDKKDGKVDIQVKAKLITSYPDEKDYQETLWYYAYRSLFHKFLYGETRAQYREPLKNNLDELMERMRRALGAET